MFCMACWAKLRQLPKEWCCDRLLEFCPPWVCMLILSCPGAGSFWRKTEPPSTCFCGCTLPVWPAGLPQLQMAIKAPWATCGWTAGCPSMLSGLPLMTTRLWLHRQEFPHRQGLRLGCHLVAMFSQSGGPIWRMAMCKSFLKWIATQYPHCWPAPSMHLEPCHPGYVRVKPSACSLKPATALSCSLGVGPADRVALQILAVPNMDILLLHFGKGFVENDNVLV